jgi:nucleotide-binding universal stress UspA family protein
MRRYALAPAGPTAEQVLIAIPERAAGWTIAQRNRGLHRILVPVGASFEAGDALRYVAGSLADHLGAVHLLNVQRPVMAGDVTPLVSARMVTAARQAAGERILRPFIALLGESSIAVTHEVAFGLPAETICRSAEEWGCTGIVIGVKSGFELADLLVGSIAARVIRLAGVPVTVVNARTAASLGQAAQPSRPAGKDRLAHQGTANERDVLADAI